MIGIPLLVFSTLSESTSTQTTVCPFSAKHTPETKPTYPVPSTEIIIRLPQFLGFRCTISTISIAPLPVGYSGCNPVLAWLWQLSGSADSDCQQGSRCLCSLYAQLFLYSQNARRRAQLIFEPTLSSRLQVIPLRCCKLHLVFHSPGL